MGCLISTEQIHSHYLKYHPELLTGCKSSAFKTVSSKYNAFNQKEDTSKAYFGDNEEYRSKLEKLHRKTMNNTKDKNIAQKPIKFNVPRFELKTNINNFNQIQNVNIINTKKYKKKSKKKKKRKRHHRELSEDNKIANQLTDISLKTMQNTSTLNKNSIFFDGLKKNEIKNPKEKYEAIIHSLFRFEQNTHDLSHLLGSLGKIESPMLMIKILFEQLWNARKVCDEQQQFIHFMNQIDAGNRMQLSFILNYLKEGHRPIYMKCYEQLQANSDWKNWKKMRLNDEKIKELKQNIQRIKENQQALNKKRGQSINVNEMQMKSIYNLKNLQSAAIQKFDLTLNSNSNQTNNDSLQESEESEDDDLDNNNNNFFGQNIDLTQALKAVDSINIKEPKPNYVDLVKDKESEEEEDDDEDDEEDDEDDDNDEWIVSIKEFLSD